MQRIGGKTDGGPRADDRRGLCRFPVGLVLVGLLTLAAYFLWTEHRSHVIAGLPYLLLLACPLMHLFHRGHRHGGGLMVFIDVN